MTIRGHYLLKKAEKPRPNEGKKGGKLPQFPCGKVATQPSYGTGAPTSPLLSRPALSNPNLGTRERL